MSDAPVTVQRLDELIKWHSFREGYESDLVMALRDYRRLREPASACQHDMLKPNTTITSHYDGKGADCNVCKRAWRMP